MRLIAALLVLAALLVAGEDDPVPFPRMAPAVGELIVREYYDQGRIRPRLMVERGLRALENAEISIDCAWADGAITVNLGGTRHPVPAAEPADLAAAMNLLEAVREVVEGSDLPPKRRRDLAYALVNGALATLDPHTLVLPPEPARAFGEDIKGEFFGIGAFLNQEDGVVRIERVMPGLPAETAGIEDGDVVLAIDGEKTAGLSLDQAIRRIKGPKGTTVTLTVERKGAKAPLDIPIVRNLVKVVSIRSWRAGGVGYVRMDEFSANTANDLYRTLAGMAKPEPLQVLVLDLRFNGGGLLDQAKLISGLFLGNGVEVVRTVSADGKAQPMFAPPSRLIGVPMVVLTSPGSASAAEILSGALQRHERAVVAGATTFGKGSVQQVRPLRDGSQLKLTIQEYQLPGGVSIQDVGVTPDLALPPRIERERGGVQVHEFARTREADDEFALANRSAYRHETALTLPWLARRQSRDEARRSAISARDFQPDPEAMLVIDLLQGCVRAPGWEQRAAAATAKGDALRAFLLAELKPQVAARAETEALALAEALARPPLGVVWGPATLPAAGSLVLEYQGPTEIAAGATAALAFRLSNRGAVDAGRLYGTVRADRASPLWEDEVVFGRVPAGGATAAAIAFAVPPRSWAGEERFTLEVRADGRPEVLASAPVVLRVAAVPRPHFRLGWELVEPGRDGALNPGEAAQVRLTVRNDGEGPTTGRVTMFVFKDNDPWVQLGANRLRRDRPLAAGGDESAWTVEVPLAVQKEIMRNRRPAPFPGTPVKLQVRVEETFADEVDGRYRASLFAILSIPVNQPVSPQPVLQPRLSLRAAAADGPDRLRLQVVVADDQPRFVALFQDEDKVDLQPVGALAPAGRSADDQPQWLYEARVRLRPGLNALRVVASGVDEVGDLLPLRVWGPEKTSAPAATGAAER